jgi:hypothetical protein
MNFSTNNKYTRCFYDPNDEDKGFVDLRTLTAEESRKISKLTTKISYKFKRGQRHEIEEVDEKKRDFLRWDYCIGEWGGTNDENGEPYENTAKNKVMLMNQSNEFCNFVLINLEKIGEAEEELKEAEAKN